MRDDGTLDDPNAPDDPSGRTADQTSPERSIRPNRLRAARELVAAPGRARMALAAGVVCCLGLATFAQASDETAGVVSRVDPLAARSELAQRAQQGGATRDLDRTPAAQVATPTATPSAAPTGAAADPDTEPDTKRDRRPERRQVDPAPVAGLTRVQMKNAEAIVRTGREMGVPRRGLVIAVATAMQESTLLNYASGVLPESQNYPHQAIGWDHDSVGLFQQRPSSGWGSVRDLMEPEFATRQFLTALEQIPGWQQMPLTDAAQAVQVSAFGWAYAQHEWAATEVVDAIAPTGR
ncbi:peptidase M23 [Micromonospora sp. WMMD812]|uniref:peptidase M23 n=1 Tax=Micromonospora sp. WMMD812 TaxID=3015152 RepID=UPI00248C86A2|nr:peptidase M23 [Micromonospora sp. WMMD812]WBB69833.1 peptidase M23 [Micromonospora sp. WMMD812]